MTNGTDKADNTERLTPQQAAVLLAVNWRTVRRWIDNGKLEGTRHPCTTTRAAVEAYKAQQQPKTGEVLSAADGDGSAHDSAAEQASAVVMALSDRLGAAIVTIERLAHDNGRLQSEVGRLEAELAQLRKSGVGSRESEEARGLARVRAWLRGGRVAGV